MLGNVNIQTHMVPLDGHMDAMITMCMNEYAYC